MALHLGAGLWQIEAEGFTLRKGAGSSYIERAGSTLRTGAVFTLRKRAGAAFRKGQGAHKKGTVSPFRKEQDHLKERVVYLH